MNVLRQRSRVSFLLQTITLLAVVGMLYQALIRLPAVFAAEKPVGARVILMRTCTQEEESNQGDGRNVYIRLRNDGSIFINDNSISAADLYPTIESMFYPRLEKVLYLVGEDDISYQRVASTAAELHEHVEGLSIFLPTTANLRNQYLCLVPNGPFRSAR